MSSISNLKDIKSILLGSGVKPADIVNGSSDQILEQLVELKHNPSLPLNFEFIVRFTVQVIKNKR